MGASTMNLLLNCCVRGHKVKKTTETNQYYEDCETCGARAGMFI